MREAVVDNGCKVLSLIYVKIVSGAAIVRRLNKVWTAVLIFYR